MLSALIVVALLGPVLCAPGSHATGPRGSFSGPEVASPRLLELGANHSELGPIDELLDGILSHLAAQESAEAAMIIVRQQRLADAESRLQQLDAMLNQHRAIVQSSAELWQAEKMKIEAEAARLRGEIASFEAELGLVDEMRTSLLNLRAVGDESTENESTENRASTLAQEYVLHKVEVCVLCKERARSLTILARSLYHKFSCTEPWQLHPGPPPTSPAPTSPGRVCRTTLQFFKSKFCRVSCSWLVRMRIRRYKHTYKHTKT